MNNLSRKRGSLISYFERKDIFLFFGILLVCLAPKFGSICVITAFCINVFRILKCDINTYMFDMMCLMPFANIYKIAPKTPSLVLLLILFGLLVFGIRSITKYRSVGASVLLACLFLFARSGMMMDALISIVCSLALVCMFGRNINDRHVLRIAGGYTVAVALSVVVAYIALPSNLYINYIFEDIQVSSYSDAVRFKGLFGDPNYLGTYLLSSIGVLGQLFITRKIKLSIFLVLFAIMTSGGIMSYSKSFFLVFIAISVLVILNLWNSGNKKWAFFFSMVLLVAGIYAAKGMFSDVNVILDRFSQDSDAEELTTGRSTLWARYANDIFSSITVFLFGHGLNAPLLVQGAHNLYLETLYYIGFIGFLLIVLAYVNSFRSTLRVYNNYGLANKSIAIMTLVILLVVYWSLQGLFGFATYFQFFIAILMFRLPLLRKDSATKSSI